MHPGLIGGIAGGVIGALGGAVGTWFAIKRTVGPRERGFMIRVAAVAWIANSAFVLGLLVLPQPQALLLWIPYLPMLAIGIPWCNRRQQAIRNEEAANTIAMQARL